MQTFLPYPDFKESAKCLDYRRLGKQRVEARQVLNAIRNGGGWSNHPVVHMWRGYEKALIVYGNAVITEWVARGYKNNMPILDAGGGVVTTIVLPWWFGDDRFHSAHRSNLLRKDFEYYNQFGWEEPTNLPYWYPTKEA